MINDAVTISASLMELLAGVDKSPAAVEAAFAEIATLNFPPPLEFSPHAKGTGPMLAYHYNGQDVTGWLMSEKLDGVRAIWTGSELVSRNGNKFNAPDWFTAQLPAGVELDGEIYLGRGNFQKVISLIRSADPDWSAVRFCVFDAPKAKGGVESRLAFAADALAGCAVASVIPQRACRDEADLAAELDILVAAGAEGVMLRAPGSRYDNYRSMNLLKMKPFATDEAEVVGSEQGITGIVGSLLLKWRGIIVKIGAGLTDELRAIPPAIGNVVTFSYCGLTEAGTPKCAAFVSERNYE